MLCRPRPLAYACLGAAAVALVCGAARADAQSAQTVADATASTNRALQSSDGKEVAWGAFTAAEYHLTSAIPPLIAALQRNLSANADSAQGTRPAVFDPRASSELAILDALVQLHAKVPADVLTSSLGRWPIPTLILLDGATGDRDAMLLQRLNTTGGFEFQAIANLLLRNKPAGFAFHLLDGLRLGLSIFVTDQPGRGFGSGLGSGSESGCNADSSAPGFPPSADYRFAIAGPGATILSVGPETVYYLRRTLTPPIVPCSAAGITERPSDRDRVKYLNALLTPRIEPGPLHETTFATVQWSTADRYREEVLQHRRALVDEYRDVISRLVSAGQLTEDEGKASAPAITITVADGRKNTSEPLPVVEDPGRRQSRQDRP